MRSDEIEALPYRPCVGIALRNADGGVFAGRRIDNPTDAWQMPQGGIDAGEDVLTAALRELTEETGVAASLVEVVDQTHDWITYDLPRDLVPKLWKGRFRGQKQKWVLMQFNGQDSDIDIHTKDAEFSHWRWMQPAELVEKIVPFKREIYDQVFAAFKSQF
jgi:putative (di)nucleoside polyphosphate hydrolase